jgi:hypothetical protein
MAPLLAGLYPSNLYALTNCTNHAFTDAFVVPVSGSLLAGEAAANHLLQILTLSNSRPLFVLVARVISVRLYLYS